jgi:hypothetical protein
MEHNAEGFIGSAEQTVTVPNGRIPARREDLALPIKFVELNRGPYPMGIEKAGSLPKT